MGWPTGFGAEVKVLSLGQRGSVLEAAYPGDPSPGGALKGHWAYSTVSSVLNLSRPEDSSISKGWSQGEPNLMTGTEKKIGHCNNGCHMLSSEVGAQN